jgi:WD40 repeat protein/tRNA A-37 threonylcarbamoyl transferase component Bud32
MAEESIDEVIAEFLEAEAAGQTPNRAAFLARHPNLADELRSFFAHHDRMRIMAEPLHTPVAAEAPTLGLDAPLSPGANVRYFGDYEILEEIARGGMGVVYKARQISLNRIVALKMILAGELASPADVQRFRTEAEAAANLDHPNIVPIYEVGEHEGQHYFSMKVIDGNSLADSFRTRSLDERAAVKLLTKVARAVHYAHQRKILHRDLKPANILIDREGTPFVTDFGLAKKVEGDRALTHTGAILGTPSYMPPEQARAETQLSTAVDVYALGAILYELITGQPPFKAATTLDTILQVLDRVPADPRKLKSQADRDLSVIAMKCLEKDPAKRYGSVEAMADDLDRWSRGESITARPASTLERAGKWAKRRPAVSALTAAVIVVFLTGSALTLVFAVQSSNRAARALESEERTKDALCRSLFEQARALRLAGHPGWRAQALDLIKQATALRARDRAKLDDALPSLADLRGEAVMAILRSDAQEVAAFEYLPSDRLCLGHDGRRALVERLTPGQNDTNLIVLDTERETELGRVMDTPKPQDGNYYYVVAMNHDGTMMATEKDRNLEMRELPSGKVIRRLPWPKVAADPATIPHMARLDFSPDGTTLLGIMYLGAAPDNGVALAVVAWSIAEPDDPRVIARSQFTTNMGGVYAGVEFSPDSRQVTVADNRQLILKGVSADNRTADIVIPLGNCWSSAWHPSASVLAVAQQIDLDGSDWRFVIWDIKAQAEVTHWQGQSEGPPALAFSRDGKILAIRTVDGLIQLHSARDGRNLVHLSAETDEHPRLRWRADGRLISGGTQDILRIWEITEECQYDEFVGTAFPPDKLAFSPDGRWLAVSALADMLRVRLVDRRTGHTVTEWSGAGGPLRFVPDSSGLVERGLFAMGVNSVPSGQQTAWYPVDTDDHNQRVHWHDMMFDANGALCAVTRTAENSELCVVNLAEKRTELILKDVKVSTDMVVPINVSTNGRWLAFSPTIPFQNDRRGRCGVWELPTGRLIADFPFGDPSDDVFPVAISPDGRWLMILRSAVDPEKGAMSIARTWDVHALPSGETVLSFPYKRGQTVECEFSPDSRFLARAGERGFVELWNVDAKQEILRWQPHSGNAIGAIKFTPEGWLATTAQKHGNLHILKLDPIRKFLEPMGLDW